MKYLFVIFIFMQLPFLVLGQEVDLKTARFKNLRGEEQNIVSSNKEIVLISFWATWCTACVDEIKVLHQIQADFEKKVDLFSVNLDEDQEKVVDFLKVNKVRFRVLRSEQGMELLKTYSGKEKLPVVLLLDKKLDFIASFSGKADVHQIDKALRLLAK